MLKVHIEVSLTTSHKTVFVLTFSHKRWLKESVNSVEVQMMNN